MPDNVKHSIALAVIFFSICICPKNIHAQKSLVQESRTTPENNSLLDEYMRKSGIDAQVERMPAVLLDRLLDKSENVPEPLLEVVRQTVLDEFDTAEFRKTIRDRIEKSIPEADLKTALVWLNSAAGMKITSVEIDATTPEAHREKETFADMLEKGGARVERIKRLEVANKGSEYAMETSLKGRIALSAAMQAAMEPSKQTDMKALEEKSRMEVEAKRSEVVRNVLLFNLYEYRNISDDELDRYIVYVGTEPLKKLRPLIHEVLSRKMVAVFEAVGRRLGEKIREIREAAQGAATREATAFRIVETKKMYELYLPIGPVLMTIPRGDRETILARQSVDSKEGNSFSFKGSKGGLSLFGSFDSSDKFPGMKKLWDADNSAWRKKGVPKPEDVTFKRVGDWQTVVYYQTTPESRNSHVRAHWVYGRVWIDVHLSSAVSGRTADETRAKLEAYLKTIQVMQSR